MSGNATLTLHGRHHYEEVPLDVEDDDMEPELLSIEEQAGLRGDPSAGIRPVPFNLSVDDRLNSAPVNAYFTFIQNNIRQVDAGGIVAVMQQAEQRHREVLHEIAQSMSDSAQLAMDDQRAAFNGELARVKDEAVAKISALEREKLVLKGDYDRAIQDLRDAASKIRQDKILTNS